jgi:iron complex transport system permease protein
MWVLGGAQMLLVIVLAAVALMIGPEGIQWAQAPHLVTAVIPGMGEADAFATILVQLRLPRVLAAIIAGVGLGLAGLGLQNALGNPLASPYTLGIAQAAAFGAALAIILLGVYQGDVAPLGLPPPLVIAASAFAAAALTLGAILALLLWARLGPYAVVLAGVALGALFHSATMLLQFFGTDIEVAATVFWTFGDLAKAGWSELAVMAGTLLLGLVAFGTRTWDMDALAWGDTVAQSVGTAVAWTRGIVLGVACLMAATLTAFLGIIGFIGLVAPHLARLSVGEDHRALVPMTSLIGAILMLGSDIVSRVVLAPVVLPVGIVTAFLGVPLFLLLLIRRARSGR